MFHLQAGPPPGSGRPAGAQATAPAREAAWRANNLGVARLEQFDYEGAAKYFRDALQLAPDLALVRLNLAIALFYGGHTADAATEARAAAARLPDVPSVHFVLGLASKAEDRLDVAIAAFTRVLQLDPADAGAKIHLGQIHLQQRRYDEALRLFQDALTAEPYNVTAAYNAALALTRAGRGDEGRQAMRRFESLRDSIYGVTYSQTYLAQGRYGEALASTGAEPDLVNPAAPPVTFSNATGTFLPDHARAKPDAPEPAGGVTLFDADNDGDLDLLEIGTAGSRFFRNDGGRLRDETARVLPFPATDVAGQGAIAGDYDNDGKPDLFLLREGSRRLLHQKADGAFEDATPAAGLPAPPPAASTAAFADADHDGDLDIVIAGAAAQLLRNNGNGTFTDITGAAGIGAEGPPRRALSIVAADFDNRRDIDILVASRGLAPALFRNMRDGTFRDAATELGLPPAAEYAAVTAGDINKDGYTDVFLAKPSGAGVFALSDGHGKFRTVPGPAASRPAVAAQLTDYDNDGLLDLLMLSGERLQVFRNTGGDRWPETGDAARLPGVAPASNELAFFQAMALGDLDRDGDTDAVIRDWRGDLQVWRNDGGNRNTSLRVRVEARVSNRSGIGAKIELRAGSLRQLLETSASSPAVAPADLVFGLGTRTAADAVRVLWPSGILQAETTLPAPSTGRSQAITVTELDRKPSSCPYLFTWNGTRFEFVTDFMGGGEMGGWAGPAAWNQPDPDEYVRIDGDRLRPRDGRYELRITNELEEALFVDRLQLVAADHPADAGRVPERGAEVAAARAIRPCGGQERPAAGACARRARARRAAADRLPRSPLP